MSPSRDAARRAQDDAGPEAERGTKYTAPGCFEQDLDSVSSPAGDWTDAVEVLVGPKFLVFHTPRVQ